MITICQILSNLSRHETKIVKIYSKQKLITIAVIIRYKCLPFSEAKKQNEEIVTVPPTPQEANFNLPSTSTVR